MSEKPSPPSLQRWWVCIVAPLIFSLVPFRAALQKSSVAGAGPDVVTTLWTMAWFRETWMGAAWGGHSDWFNFPFGGSGAILSPLTATLWSILSVVIGDAPAATWTSILLLWGMCLAVFWMGRQAGWSWLASGCAILALLVPRYALFTLGETGVVGIAAFPMIIGMGVALRLCRSGHWWWVLLFALCMTLQGLENPYLTPVLPLFTALLLFRADVKKHLLNGLALGVLGVFVVGFIHHGATAANYESVIPNTFIEVSGHFFPVIERPWARIGFMEMVWPERVLWTYGVMDSIHIGGRGYMGLSVLLISVGALLVRPKQTVVWFFLGVLGLLLASGSQWGEGLSLFGLLNSAADRLVRALTQPSRYLVLAMLGFAGSIAIFVNWLEKKRGAMAWAVWGILLCDGLLFGGLSLRLPDMTLPNASCMSGLQNVDGGVLIWPWDGADDEDSRATLQSRLFQVVHRHPGATIGTGSWPLVGSVFPGHFLRQLGWRKALSGRGELDLQQLADWGYTAVVLDHTALRNSDKRGRDEVFVDLEIISTGTACTVLQLPPPNPDAAEPLHPGSDIEPILFLDNER